MRRGIYLFERLSGDNSRAMKGYEGYERLSCWTACGKRESTCFSFLSPTAVVSYEVQQRTKVICRDGEQYPSTFLTTLEAIPDYLIFIFERLEELCLCAVAQAGNSWKSTLRSRIIANVTFVLSRENSLNSWPRRSDRVLFRPM